MRQIMPGANVARLVGILWDNNDPPNHPSSDCMTNDPPHYFDDRCFDTLDPWVKTATDNGIWVILAVRSQVGAGQYFDTKPGTVVFRNSTLKTMFYAMWAHVATHYASFDRIAAYEIMSEPRDKTVTQEVVRDFYEGGCAVVKDVDPRTPCMWNQEKPSSYPRASARGHCWGASCFVLRASSVSSRGGSLLLSLSADVRSSDDVIAFERHGWRRAVLQLVEL